MPNPILLPERPGLRAPAVRLLGTALSIFALGLVPGCGPGVGAVSGKVSFKGKEVTSGFVTLIGRDGIPNNSEIAEDGSYRLAKIPAGEVKIVVRSPPVDPAKSDRQAPKRPGAEPRDEPGPTFTEKQKKTWREIPMTYADVTKSDLRYTVTPGINTYNIELKEMPSVK